MVMIILYSKVKNPLGHTLMKYYLYDVQVLYYEQFQEGKVNH